MNLGVTIRVSILVLSSALKYSLEARLTSTFERWVRKSSTTALESLFRQKPVVEWLRLCANADVPAGPVNTLNEVFADPQVLARGMLVEMPHPTAGTVRLAGTPLNLSTTPTQIRLPPPLLGDHTQEILSNVLALEDSSIAELRQNRVI